MDKNRSFPNPHQPADQNQSSHNPQRGEERENLAMTGNQPPELESDEWETVNFPNAIRIEELEAATPARSADVPVTPTTPPQTPPNSASGNNTGISQIAELIALIQQVRQRNNELNHRVATLENALHECQIALDLTQNRSQTQEALLNERTQELESAQSKNKRLTYELEATSQNAQRQQILIQTLSEQLETSQHRLAQMERECTLTQQRYSEQTQQLMQVENTCRDLRSRLHRQQRHTLQFKAALEKCLEMPDSMRDKKLDVIENAGVPTGLSESGGIEAGGKPETVVADTTSLTPKADAIKPWAAATGPADTAPKNPVEIYTDSVADWIPNSSLEMLDMVKPAPTLENAGTKTVPSGDAILWENITQLIDATQTPKPAEQPESPTPTPKPFLAPLIYPQQMTKKRHSLAAIDLPSFPRLQDGAK